jgi:hypothetical protein
LLLSLSREGTKEKIDNFPSLSSCLPMLKSEVIKVILTTMVIHLEDAPVAHGAMMSPRWFDFITDIALLGPKLLELGYCLAPILEKSLDIN